LIEVDLTHVKILTDSATVKTLTTTRGVLNEHDHRP
jgi:hypothetical protein